jgi:phenylalanyl-tRNA synthetase beta chain
VKIPLSWLAEFVQLPSDLTQLRNELDDLGLVVEGVEHIGEGLSDVVVARVEEIRSIEGADRIRLVIANCGTGPVEIVCGAMNFEVGNFVPMAPVGAVLPGGFEIAQRKMRGVVSNGMLCSPSELGLSDQHGGLMILDAYDGVHAGQSLLELLAVVPDVVFEISPEGNRPDAWSIEGVARDLAARSGQVVAPLEVASTNSEESSSAFASAAISAPELCGALSVGVIRNVTVTPSPRWLQRRLEMAGMRAVNNVVDASNYVMLELGQPTHPYDAALVAGSHLGVRQAHEGELLTTLDGTVRSLGSAGRSLGDTGVDCVIVDANGRAIGLAGVMGGESSEISASTTDVLVEAAFFDPMAIARTSKRHGLRSEASARFERGVDSDLAPRALGRFVALLQLSSPALQWLKSPLQVAGTIATRPPIEVTGEQIASLLGTPIATTDAARFLRAIGFGVSENANTLTVMAPRARLDVREGAAGRADVIEEIARLYGYRRLLRRTPTWVQPGSLSSRQQFRRVVRDSLVGLGYDEAWTASLISDADYDLVAPAPQRVTVTNPLAADEAVLRCSMIVGLTRAWAKNLERGHGDVALFEMGTVFEHPAWAATPRTSRGGSGGTDVVELPSERELLTILLARESDDASSVVASWRVVAQRLSLADVVLRSAPAPKGWHPTRFSALVDRASGVIFGHVGEIDPSFVGDLVPSAREGRRVGLLEIDLGILANTALVTRRANDVTIPSRFPAAAFDLAFVTPNSVNADDLANSLRICDERIESVELFDVFRSDSLGLESRSLAYAIRISAMDRTLSEVEIGQCREALLSAARDLGAQLR